jgi:hypothetical protein
LNEVAEQWFVIERYLRDLNPLEDAEPSGPHAQPPPLPDGALWRDISLLTSYPATPMRYLQGV